MSGDRCERYCGLCGHPGSAHCSTCGNCPNTPHDLECDPVTDDGRTRMDTRETLRLFASLRNTQLVWQSQEESSRLPVEPPEGAVLRYQKQFPNSPKTYSYIAVRAGDRWYRTGRHSEPVSFPELVEDIANWPCHVALTWGEIPQAPAALFEGVDPAVWFEEMYRNTVTSEGTTTS